MTLTKEQIRNAAMELPAEEREELAEELMYSITAAEADAIDAAWLAEVQRRSAEFQAGKTTARPIEEVLARLEAKARR